MQPGGSCNAYTKVNKIYALSTKTKIFFTTWLFKIKTTNNNQT